MKNRIRDPIEFITKKYLILKDKGMSFMQYQKNGEYEFIYSGYGFKLEIYFISGFFTDTIDFVIEKNFGRCNITKLPFKTEIYKNFILNYNNTKKIDEKIDLVLSFVLEHYLGSKNEGMKSPHEMDN